MKINKLLFGLSASLLLFVGACGSSKPLNSEQIPLISISEESSSTRESSVKPSGDSSSSENIPTPSSYSEEIFPSEEISEPDTPNTINCDLFFSIKIENVILDKDNIDLDDFTFEYIRRYLVSDGSLAFVLQEDLSYQRLLLYDNPIENLVHTTLSEFIKNGFALENYENAKADIKVGVWDEDFRAWYSSSTRITIKPVTYHEVSFYNNEPDHTLLYETKVKDGHKVTYPYENPVCESEDSEFYNITFKGWRDYNDEVAYDSSIYQDVEFIAQYDYEFIPHTVKYYAEDETTLLEEKQADHYEATKYTGELPTKEADLENDIQYSFKEWKLLSKEGNTISYAATFEEYTRGLVFEGNVIKAYVGTKKEVTTPSKINGVVIDTVGPQCFETRNVEKVILNDTITKIGDKSFYNVSSLKEIVFSANLEVIGQEAFYGCSSLREVALPNTLMYAASNAFTGCSSLEEVTIPGALYNSPLDNDSTNFITIFNNPDHVYDVVNIISNGNDTIDTNYLSNASIVNLNIGEGIVNINYRAFENIKNLENLSLGKDVKSIGNNVAQKTSIKSLTIVGDDTEIGVAAFLGCSKLEEINLGNTKIIGNQAFSGCLKLASFKGGNVETIGNQAFYNCSSLTSFIVPNATKTIGNSAFVSCFKLREIILGDNLESIGDQAFANCFNLSIVYIYSDLQNIGSGAFSNCSNLTYIFSVNELKPVHYTAGWYGDAQPIFGYEKTEFDDDYVYYYASEYGYKKVYMLNKDYTEIDEEITLPKFKDGYEIIRLSNPTIAYINNIMRPNTFVKTPGSGGHTMKPYPDVASYDGYESLLTDLTLSNLPRINKYSSSGYQYSFEHCYLEGIGSFNRLIILALGNEFNSNDFATLISNMSGWYIVWMGDYYLAYYEGKDIYITFKDNIDEKLYVEYYGQYKETYDDNPSAGDEPAVIDDEQGEESEEKPIDQIIKFQLNSSYDGYIATSLLDDTITELVIPSTYNELPVIEIGDRFAGYKLHYRTYAKLVIPSSVKKIGEFAFYLFNVSNIELNEGLEEIGRYAFGNVTTISSIDIPSTVNKMDANPFIFCLSLQNITFSHGSDYFTVQDKVLFTKDMKKLITFMPKKAGDYTVPNTVEVIGDGSFGDIRTKHSVTLPTSIKTIEWWAFTGNTCITSLSYLGTKAQFNKINLVSGWNSLCYLSSVICSDGNVSISN